MHFLCSDYYLHIENIQRPFFFFFTLSIVCITSTGFYIAATGGCKDKLVSQVSQMCMMWPPSASPKFVLKLLWTVLLMFSFFIFPYLASKA